MASLIFFFIIRKLTYRVHAQLLLLACAQMSHHVLVFTNQSKKQTETVASRLHLIKMQRER